MDVSTWVEQCKTAVDKYVQDGYRAAREIGAEYQLETVWEMPGEDYNRVLFRTNLNDRLRYLVIFKVEDETTSVQPYADGPIGSDKS